MISLRPVIWQCTRYVTPKRSFTAIARTVNSVEFLQIQNENNNNFFIRGITNDDYEENFVKGCEYYEKNYQNFIETRQRNFTSTYGLLGKAVFLNNPNSLYFIRPEEKPTKYVQEFIENVENTKFITSDADIPDKFEIWKRPDDLSHLLNWLFENKELEETIFFIYLKFIDKASCSSLKIFDSRKNPIPHLHLLYEWFEVKEGLKTNNKIVSFDSIRLHIISQKHNNWSTSDGGFNYPKKFIELAMENIEDFSPEEYLFLLYICGFYGHIPGSKRHTSTAMILQKYKANQCAQDWQTWNILERSLACHVLQLCRIKLNFRGCESLKECIKSSFMSLPDDVIENETLSPVIINPMIQLLNDNTQGIYNFNESEVEEICARYGESMPRLSDSTKSLLIDTIIQSGSKGPNVQDFIHQWTNSLQTTFSKIRNIDSDKLKEMYNVIQNLFKMQYHKMNSIIVDDNNITQDPILKIIFQNVRKSNLRDLHDLRLWIISLVYLTRMGALKDSNSGTDTLFETINNYTAFHELDSDEFIWKGKGFGKYMGLSDNWKRKDAPYVMQEIFQYFAEMDFLIEINNHSSSWNIQASNNVRLDPEIRKKFLKSYITKNTNVAKEMDQNQNRKVVFREIEKFFSSPNKVFFGPLLPYHASMSEIVVCVNENLEAIDIDPKVRSILQENTNLLFVKDLDIPEGFHWHCIIMPKIHHYNANGTLNAHVTYKKEHLEKLGYRVSIVQETRKNSVEKLTKNNVKSLLFQHS